jgi:hypothetical protein
MSCGATVGGCGSIWAELVRHESKDAVTNNVSVHVRFFIEASSQGCATPRYAWLGTTELPPRHHTQRRYGNHMELFLPRETLGKRSIWTHRGSQPAAKVRTGAVGRSARGIYGGDGDARRRDGPVRAHRHRDQSARTYNRRTSSVKTTPARSRELPAAHDLVLQPEETRLPSVGRKCRNNRPTDPTQLGDVLRWSFDEDVACVALGWALDAG